MTTLIEKSIIETLDNYNNSINLHDIYTVKDQLEQQLKNYNMK